MKNILLILFGTALMACSDKEVTTAQSLSMYHSPMIDTEIAMDNPYRLTLDLETVENGSHHLVANMDLFGGSFYVSPHATGDFKGKFAVEVPQNEHVILGDDFTESPCSKEVFDPHPFVNGLVNWVQEDTEYHYPLSMNTDQDFKVSGFIRFTIEPKCTLEEIPFDIICENGQLRVQRYPALDKRTCTTAAPDQTMTDVPETDEERASDHPYDLSSRVAETASGFKWMVEMRLNGGSFYVSPSTTRDFKGKFKVEVAPNEHLSIGARFIETSLSGVVLDLHPFGTGEEHWVTEDMRYEFPLLLNTQNDFEIGGKISFVIEPKCTLEEIPVLFRYRNGKLTVEKFEC